MQLRPFCNPCNRLYATQLGDEGGEFKLDLVQLKYDEEGKEQWVPVKQVSATGHLIAWSYDSITTVSEHLVNKGLAAAGHKPGQYPLSWVLWLWLNSSVTRLL